MELLLCRDVFHCTPAQLDAEDNERIERLLAVLAAEQQVERTRQRATRL